MLILIISRIFFYVKEFREYTLFSFLPSYM